MGKVIQKSEIDKWLNLEKQISGRKLINGNKLIFNFSKKDTLQLKLSNKEVDFTFEYKITLNTLAGCKISMHHQENKHYTPIVRIDYNGRHRNPPYKDDVPMYFKEFSDMWINESHIHIYVEGHGSNWAIPLSKSDFLIKSIDNTNINSNFATAVQAFNEYINLKDEIELIRDPTVYFDELD